MGDLLTYIRSQKKARLDALEQTCRAESEQELEPLRAEVKRLSEAIRRQTETGLTARERQLQYEIEFEFRNRLSARREQLLGQLWNETTGHFFADQVNLRDWLKRQMSQWMKAEGMIRAGDSYDMLRELLASSEQLKLQRDDSIAEPGFVLQMGNRRIDLRLSVFLEERWSTQRIAINQLLLAAA